MLANLVGGEQSFFGVARMDAEYIVGHSVGFENVSAGLFAVDLDVELVVGHAHALDVSRCDDQSLGSTSFRLVIVLRRLICLEARVDVQVGDSFYRNQSESDRRGVFN